MSYLDVPRIHVFGAFFTDPSSINNDPVHYDPTQGPPSPWQIPNGKHWFQWKSCKVVNVLDDQGNPAGSDPLIGAPFESTDLFATYPMNQPGVPVVPSPARIVDLDVYQQGVSAIYGLQIRITVGSETLVGDVTPAPILNSNWFNHTLRTRGWGDDSQNASYGNDSDAIGAFQTRIRIAKSNWGITSSPALAALKKLTYSDDKFHYLSFKFFLDSYLNVYAGSPAVNTYHGRMVGTIGPVLAPSEPIQSHGARWLNPRLAPDDNSVKNPPWFYPKFYGAPFKVDEKRKKLVLDLAGAIATKSIAVLDSQGNFTGGEPVDLGTLTAYIAPKGQPEVAIGPVNYQMTRYVGSAGISELDLTDQQIALLSNAPLQLRTSRTEIISDKPEGAPNVLAEDPSGLCIAADQRVVRMTSDVPDAPNPTTQAYVTVFGKPKAGFQLQIEIVPVKGTTPGATVPRTNPGDSREADGAIAASATPTDALGRATITLKTVKPVPPRTPWLDGQLYFVNLYVGQPWGQKTQIQEQQISVLLFSPYPVKQNPVWEDVRVLMEPYNVLYPVMKRAQLDLTDEHSFLVYSWNPPWKILYGFPPDYVDPIIHKLSSGAIPLYLSRDIEDPRYMPISRDLSPNKIKTIFNYIALTTPPDTQPGIRSHS